jgi:hypothetical protein
MTSLLKVVLLAAAFASRSASPCHAAPFIGRVC